MRVLVAYERLDTPAGTEVYALTVAEHLERLGHDAVLVTWAEGAMAERARRRGLRIVRPEAGDVADAELVIACDGASLLALAERAPGAVRVFVVHSTEYVAQTPPQLDDACHGVVVLNDRTRHRAEALAVPVPVLRLRQPIDLARYRLLPPPRRPIARVMVFGHLAGGAHPRAFPDACRAAGIDPVVLGNQAGTATTDPELALAEVDAVLGIGRCALEGMAARRPAFVAGPAGLDGWVTPELFEAMEADGFSGRVEGRAGAVDDLVAALATPPSRAAVQALYERVVREHDARVHAEAVVGFARRLGADARPCRGPLAEMARLARLEFNAQDRADGSVEALRASVGRERVLERRLAAEEAASASLRTELEELRSGADELRRRIDAIESSRRWRATERLLAPLDAVRRRAQQLGSGSGS